MSERRRITEEEGVHKEWYERASSIRLETLPDFLRELTEDYQHDYGTICHAIAASAIAAAWAVESTPQGGITGFQAGAVGWEFLKNWGSPSVGETGARILSYDDLLYPQYAERFTSISSDVLKAVREKAATLLEENKDMANSAVIQHWQMLLAGGVPFGLTVTGD